MQLSKNQNIFAEFFSAFKKSASNLKYFEEEEDHPQRLFAFEIIEWKNRGYLIG